jgi:hypothetical protein
MRDSKQTAKLVQALAEVRTKVSDSLILALGLIRNGLFKNAMPTLASGFRGSHIRCSGVQGLATQDGRPAYKWQAAVPRFVSNSPVTTLTCLVRRLGTTERLRMFSWMLTILPRRTNHLIVNLSEGQPALGMKPRSRLVPWTGPLALLEPPQTDPRDRFELGAADRGQHVPPHPARHGEAHGLPGASGRGCPSGTAHVRGARQQQDPHVP